MPSSYSVCIVSPGEDNKQFTVPVKDTMRVRELRQTVASKLSLQPINIRLSHSDVPMEDSNTLATYGLQDNSKIYVAIFEQRATTVTVSGVSGATTVEKVFAGDTVEKFLQRYQKKQGATTGFKLTRRGEEIRDGQVLSEMELEEGEMLHVLSKIQGGEDFHNNSN